MRVYSTWPDASHKWWWMEFQRTPRCKKQVMLVRLVEHDGTEYIQPHQDNNCYPKSFTEEWSARFKPCESSPDFD